jgi:hypothetical protein
MPYMKGIDIYGVYFIKDERFTYKYYFYLYAVRLYRNLDH